MTALIAGTTGRLAAVIETTAVRVIRLADVGLAHPLGEGGPGRIEAHAP